MSLVRCPCGNDCSSEHFECAACRDPKPPAASGERDRYDDEADRVFGTITVANFIELPYQRREADRTTIAAALRAAAKEAQLAERARILALIKGSKPTRTNDKDAGIRGHVDLLLAAIEGPL